MKKLIGLLKRTEGSLYIYGALAILPLIGFVGLSIDMSRAYHNQALIASAVDAATMAAAKVSSEEANNEAKRVFNAYIKGSSAEKIALLKPVKINNEDGTVEVSAETEVEMVFLKAIGQDKIGVGATSQVKLDQQDVEIAIVVDSSGGIGMRNEGSSKLSSLQEALVKFIELLFKGQDTGNGFYVALIPFVTQVNVGYRPTWLKSEGQKVITDSSKFPSTSGGKWRGCVNARIEKGLDQTDTPPSLEVDRFMPFWWASTKDIYPYPEEMYADPQKEQEYREYADRQERSSFYESSESKESMMMYSDEGGAPSKEPVSEDKSDPPQTDDGRPVYPSKLEGAGDNDWESKSSLSASLGPNAGCPSPLLPLSNVKSEFIEAVKHLESIKKGGAFIFTGLQWGLRVLSDRWRNLWHGSNPEELPKDFGASKKVLMLISSSPNSWIGTASPWSEYLDRQMTSYGRWYGSSNKELNHNVITPNTLNDYTLQMCDIIKSQGIEIYTIAFGIDDSEALEVMEKCATGPKCFFNIKTGDDLKFVTEKVSKDFSKLRYAWPEGGLKAGKDE